MLSCNKKMTKLCEKLESLKKNYIETGIKIIRGSIV